MICFVLNEQVNQLTFRPFKSYNYKNLETNLQNIEIVTLWFYWREPTKV